MVVILVDVVLALAVVAVFGQRPRRELEGTKSCRIQGQSVRLYVRMHAYPLSFPEAGPPHKLAKASRG